MEFCLLILLVVFIGLVFLGTYRRTKIFWMLLIDREQSVSRVCIITFTRLLILKLNKRNMFLVWNYYHFKVVFKAVPYIGTIMCADYTNTEQHRVSCYIWGNIEKDWAVLFFNSLIIAILYSSKFCECGMEMQTAILFTISDWCCAITAIVCLFLIFFFLVGR